MFGLGATRIIERSMAVRHQLVTTPIHFESCSCVNFAGVLVLLPFLIQSGLLSYKSHYKDSLSGYYFLDFIVLLQSYLYLCRIKNAEQLKKINPGEFGKLLGLDRIPECRCWRSKLNEIYMQNKSDSWNMELADMWSGQENNEFYYIDGHVEVYTGYQANLGKKHVARQKLCLPGIQEFWVNNMEGLPYFYVTGQVNEKLLEILSDQIVPKLLSQITPRYSQEELDNDVDLPLFTIVFDREGYSPLFFKKLWQQHRVAVLTYRKNVKDIWDESDFHSYTIENDNDKTQMKLAEKTIELNKVPMREVRKLSDDGHQTSIITTNKKIELTEVAKNMFSRWTQENYFKYLRSNYDFDRMTQYVVQQADSNYIVANPEYNNLSYYIKKTNEKISRRKAELYDLINKNLTNSLDTTKPFLKKQAKINEEINDLSIQVENYKNQRSSIPSRIKIGEMPENIRYDRLDTESKHFQNIIKMICYRAETYCANVLAGFYGKYENEKRDLVKSIINTRGDIIVDNNNTLTIRLYSLANPRMNRALEMLCQLLNEANFKYPGTDMNLFYEIAK